MLKVCLSFQLGVLPPLVWVFERHFSRTVGPAPTWTVQ
jgi:hypothetical protein